MASVWNYHNYLPQFFDITKVHNFLDTIRDFYRKVNYGWKMIRSAEKKNNFFYFWEKNFCFYFGRGKIFLYFLDTWDLFLLFPPDSKGEKSVSQTNKVNK